MAMILRSLLLATLLSTAAAAQPADPVKRKAERDLLEKVVEIPTVKGRGQMSKLTALLAGEFRAAGITDIVIKDHDGTQTMIVRWPASKPSGRKPILLMAHMDVVEANPADWKHDPFTFREENGHYLGRGVLDNKAGLVGMMIGALNLKRSGFQSTRDIIFLFTGDEETEQNGARRAGTEWRSLIDAEYALNSDAGGGSLYKDGRVESFVLQLAEKGYADYRFAAVNRGGHSSAPRPDNAIYALAGALQKLEHYRFTPMINDASRAFYTQIGQQDKGAYGELVRAWLADPQDREKADQLETMDPGYTRTRCVPTMLSGGHAPNALPQKAEANVNCRIFPGVTGEQIRSELQAVAGKDVTVEMVDPPVVSAASPMRQDLLEAYREALAPKFPNAPILPWMSAGASDGAYLRAAGIPTYGVGGFWTYVGETYGAHGLNERVLIEGFHDQIPFWEKLLKNLAG
jgi:acetylornithine deacetylase/succinyl-diaminopimelate desuccinylase-like protein